MIPEGAHVGYIGSGERDIPLATGDQGVVIMAADNGSHVFWNTGECFEHISLIANKKLELLDSFSKPKESSYTEDDPIGIQHLATCPTCNGEGVIPEED
jgi:hypothetical protein